MSKEIATRPPVSKALAQYTSGSNQDLEGHTDQWPVLSIRGGFWRLKQDGVTSVLTDKRGEPRATLPVVILAVRPDNSRTYFGSQGYQEGDTDAPVCTSRNGITPDVSSIDVQSTTCAACPQNVFGSAINEKTGAKSKACSTMRQMSVLIAGVKEPALIRLPYKSIESMSQYRRELDEIDAHYRTVITLLRFDTETSFAKINFSMHQWATPKMQEIVAALLAGGTPFAMLGLEPSGQPKATPDARATASAPPVEQPAPVDSGHVTINGDFTEEDEAPAAEPAPEKKAKATRKKPAKAAAKSETLSSESVAESAEGIEVDDGLDELLAKLDGDEAPAKATTDEPAENFKPKASNKTAELQAMEEMLNEFNLN